MWTSDNHFLFAMTHGTPPHTACLTSSVPVLDRSVLCRALRSAPLDTSCRSLCRCSQTGSTMTPHPLPEGMPTARVDSSPTTARCCPCWIGQPRYPVRLCCVFNTRPPVHELSRHNCHTFHMCPPSPPLARACLTVCRVMWPPPPTLAPLHQCPRFAICAGNRAQRCCRRFHPRVPPHVPVPHRVRPLECRRTTRPQEHPPRGSPGHAAWRTRP